MKHILPLLLLVLLGSLTLAAQAPKDTLCYELRIYTAHPGKLNDLLRRFRDHTTALFEKHGMTNVGYWTPIDNPDGKLYYVLSYPNRAAAEASWKAFGADTTWQRVARESEVNGPVVAKVESVFLRTTDFSPNNLRHEAGHPIWELRIYTTAPNALEHLLNRFRGFTLDRFERYGMTNKMYWTTTDSENLLYYFLTHPSPKEAKAAFGRFVKDPDWIRVRKASEEASGGPLPAKIESIYLYPTDFSPIR